MHAIASIFCHRMVFRHSLLVLALCASVCFGLLAETAPAQEGQPPFAAVLKDAQPIDGLLRLYRPGNQLIAEFSDGDYAHEYIVLISIARGIGQNPLVGGMSWGFGDDWVVSFRKVGDKVHMVRRNVRFRADRDSPESRAVQNAYTDSVLFSLPVITKGPRGGDLVDLTPVFMSDLPQIGQVLPGFGFAPDKSVWAAVKGFPRNVELQVAATYASAGMANFDSVADSRGVTLHVHYSISRIPQSDYQPRLADDRVGYFLTVVKDFSKPREEEQFVRYINRWHLKKANPQSEKSVPAEPVVFWIEKTVPYQYRGAIQEGIEEWNRAFEKAGFVRAIEVRQQPDDATWDPEDIYYNTFRWITSNAGFAMGPSRVNPYTGQILDADIIFDADFIESWQSKFDLFGPRDVAELTGGPLDEASYREAGANAAAGPSWLANARCLLRTGMTHQMAFGQTALMAGAAGGNSAQQREKLIMEGLKEVTMHEVGHTLGLRHNFKASTLLTLDEMNQPEKTRATGLAASVMDYLPPNIAPPGAAQGEYYSSTIGPYDYWAIEYGYKQLAGNPDADRPQLAAIAARSGETGLVFSTDENTRGIDPDPYSNRFDLGKDPLAYARRQAQTVAQLMPTVVDRMVKEGESYAAARRALNVLLAEHGRALFFVARMVGGVDVNRSHKGDKDAPPPFRSLAAADQRAALDLLQEQVFSDKPYLLDSKLYNFLAPAAWSHWGVEFETRSDFPVHEVIEQWQSRVLDQLLSPLTLRRILDSEQKAAADQDVLTVAELLDRLTASIFAEFRDVPAGTYNNRQPAVSSIRRNLQRNYLRRLGELALGRSGSPEDCQALAYSELKELGAQLDKAAQSTTLDAYSRAHVVACQERIRKLLDASFTLASP